MRIGIDAHMIGDHSGGNESFYSGVFGEFQPDKGDDYFLFLKEGVDDTAYCDRFNIVRFKSHNAFIRNFVELSILAKKLKLDLLHTQYYIPFIRPCPVICTIHDICFEHYKDIFTKGEYFRNKLLIPYAAKHSAGIVTVSEFSKKDIAERYHISPKKIHVVYNAVDPVFRKMTLDELAAVGVREKYAIGNDPYIISVGNLQPRKNIPRLIQAYSMYKKRHPEKQLKLVIVGKKAWMYDEILKHAQTDPSNIVLTGYVEREDLVALINEARGFVYPSIFEGFGIPPLEALACGTQAAVSDIPVMREVLGESTETEFFDPLSVESICEAIERLVNKSVIEGADVLRRYSWKKSAEVMREIYMALCYRTTGQREKRLDEY